MEEEQFVNFDKMLSDNNKFLNMYIAKIQSVEYFTYGKYLKSLSDEDSAELSEILSVALTHLRWLCEAESDDEHYVPYDAGEDALRLAGKLLCLAITGDGGQINEDTFTGSIDTLVFGAIMNRMHRMGEVIFEYDNFNVLGDGNKVIVRKI